jgi:hypothetical protein
LDAHELCIQNQVRHTLLEPGAVSWVVLGLVGNHHEGSVALTEGVQLTAAQTRSLHLDHDLADIWLRAGELGVDDLRVARKEHGSYGHS